MSEKKQKDPQITISSRVGVKDLATGLRILKKKYDITPSSRSYAVSLIIKAFATQNSDLLEGSKDPEDPGEFINNFFSRDKLFLTKKEGAL